jgi:flagellar protein FliO/FliZ
MWRAAWIAMLFGLVVASAQAETATVAVSAQTSESPAAEVAAESTNKATVEAPETFRLKQDVPRGEGTSMGAASLQMMAGLIVVLALIVGLSWLARRFNLAGVGAASSMKITAALSVGAKEKILVLEVENQRLLVGVTAQQISLLRVLGDAPEAPTGSDFANRMQTLLKAGSFK